MNNAAIPIGARSFFNGSYYKIGLMGYVFLFCDGEWVRSSKSRHEVMQEELLIKRQ